MRSVWWIGHLHVVILLFLTPHVSFAQQEGVEVRAARVCAGIGQGGGNFQGNFNVGNLNIQGNANGTVTVKRDGVDLGKIEQGTYRDYTSCLIDVIKLISITSPRVDSPLAIRPTRTYTVCAGNGGGPSCAAGANKYMTCAQYRAIGGGGQPTVDALVKEFCEYTDTDGTKRLAPYKFIHRFSVGGGECGWTGFEVTCNP